ncbi:MAG: hypothetical protein V3U65_13565 [Granulosicoccaceae bacterium]
MKVSLLTSAIRAGYKPPLRRVTSSDTDTSDDEARSSWGGQPGRVSPARIYLSASSSDGNQSRPASADGASVFLSSDVLSKMAVESALQTRTADDATQSENQNDGIGIGAYNNEGDGMILSREILANDQPRAEGSLTAEMGLILDATKSEAINVNNAVNNGASGVSIALGQVATSFGGGLSLAESVIKDVLELNSILTNIAEFRVRAIEAITTVHRSIFKSALKLHVSMFKSGFGLQRALLSSSVSFYQSLFKGAIGFFNALFTDAIGFRKMLFGAMLGFHKSLFKGAIGLHRSFCKGFLGADNLLANGIFALNRSMKLIAQRSKLVRVSGDAEKPAYTKTPDRPS